jgi:hypothetical protein
LLLEFRVYFHPSIHKLLIIFQGASMRTIDRLLVSLIALSAVGSVFAQTGSGGSDGSIAKCSRNLGTLAVA